MKARSWYAGALVHIARRFSVSGPFSTMCGYVLKTKSHRAVSDKQTTTCLPCIAYESVR